MSTVRVSDDVISKISRIFSNARKSSNGKTVYSISQKELVLSALAGGYSVLEVGRAAGVSRSAIYSWQRGCKDNEPSRKPIKLDLIRSGRIDASSHPIELGAECRPKAYIRFRSGAVMEVEMMHISSMLIVALNGSDV